MGKNKPMGDGFCPDKNPGRIRFIVPSSATPYLLLCDPKATQCLDEELPRCKAQAKLKPERV
nr:hypothetical protein [uncultured Desulfobacter sp.]